MAKGISPGSAVRSASGFLWKAAGEDLASKLLGSPPTEQAALWESSLAARHFGITVVLWPWRSARQIMAPKETLGALPGARFGTTLPFWPCLLKKAHQSSNWKLTKCGGLAWFWLEIRAINLPVGHQPWWVSRYVWCWTGPYCASRHFGWILLWELVIANVVRPSVNPFLTTALSV